MMVLARDTVASDHLVYAWPFPIGPECEVACAEDEQVVMCPAWMVGDRLGPGRHRWRTPDPSRPIMAYFVLTTPVEVSFDLVTSFLVPSIGLPVRLRASGSLQVRCADPGLLVAQFVGLPFDGVNDGVMRSVSRSVERMLARLLTRRVVMAATPMAVTDPGMLASIVEELIAYNPTAGAVFGIELIRMGHLAIAADDGQAPYLALPAHNIDYSGGVHRVSVEPTNGSAPGAHGHVAPAEPSAHLRQFPRAQTPRMADTMRGMAPLPPPPTLEPAPAARQSAPRIESAPPTAASGEIVVRSSPRPAASAVEAAPASVSPPSVVSGEIGGRRASPAPGVVSGEIGGRTASPAPSVVSGEIGARTASHAPVASGEIGGRPTTPMPPLAPRTKPPSMPPPLPRVAARATARTAHAETLPPPSADMLVPPRAPTATPAPGPGSAATATASTATVSTATASTAIASTATASTATAGTGTAEASGAAGGAAPEARSAAAAGAAEPRGAILGIGVAAIGSAEVAGEHPATVAAGRRVLVPGPHGLMQSATVRQLLQGYYELEIGSTGETVWVPISGVVPE